MIKRPTLLGAMLACALLAGSAATPARAQSSKQFIDFTWDSRNGSILPFYRAGGVPVTTSEYVCGLVRIWGEFLTFDDYLVLASSELSGQVAGGQWYLSGSTVRPISATASGLGDAYTPPSAAARGSGAVARPCATAPVG